MTEQIKTHYNDPEEMHEAISQRLKEMKDYTDEFVELFRYDKDSKIKMPENILTLRFRHVVLADKTLVSISDLFGVTGLSCDFKKFAHNPSGSETSKMSKQSFPSRK